MQQTAPSGREEQGEQGKAGLIGENKPEQNTEAPGGGAQKHVLQRFDDFDLTLTPEDMYGDGGVVDQIWEREKEARATTSASGSASTGYGCSSLAATLALSTATLADVANRIRERQRAVQAAVAARIDEGEAAPTNPNYKR